MNIKPIKTKTDYRATLAEIETLMGAKANSADGERLDILVTLVEAYERRIEALLPGLSNALLPLAIRIAEVAEQVRGFGPVKAQQMALAATAWAALDREWVAAGMQPDAPLTLAA